VFPGARLESLKFSGIGHEIDLSGFVLVFTMLAFVGTVHVINMMDGVNGLVLGMAVVWFSILLWFADVYWICITLTALLSATIVISVFNLLNKLFLGDSGAYLIGSSVALFCIVLYNDSSLSRSEIAFDQMVVWILIPMLDGARVTFQRLISGRSPFRADRSHLHHYLSARIGARFAMPIIVAVVACSSLASIVWPMLSIPIIAIVIGIYFGFLALHRKFV